MGAWRPETRARGAAGTEPHVRHRPDDALRKLLENNARSSCSAATSARNRHERARATGSERDSKGLFELAEAVRRRHVAEQEELEPYRSLRSCGTCRGERLKPQSLAVRVAGRTISGLREPADR